MNLITMELRTVFGLLLILPLCFLSTEAFEEDELTGETRASCRVFRVPHSRNSEN